MLTERDGRPLDLGRGREVLGEGPPERLDRAVEAIPGEGVDRVLHRVGGDDGAVVAGDVRGLERPVEGDADRQVADDVAVRSPDDPDEPDRLLAVAVVTELDHERLPGWRSGRPRYR